MSWIGGSGQCLERRIRPRRPRLFHRWTGLFSAAVASECQRRITLDGQTGTSRQDPEMTERLIVAAASGAGLRLERGEQLRIIDVEGGQTGDLVAISADGRQRLCSGRTFDYGG